MYFLKELNISFSLLQLMKQYSRPSTLNMIQLHISLQKFIIFNKFTIYIQKVTGVFLQCKELKSTNICVNT